MLLDGPLGREEPHSTFLCVRMLFEHIREFNKMRSKVKPSTKPFSKKKLADDFAYALTLDLKDAGLKILHESEKTTSLTLATKAGYLFSIRPDAVILKDNLPKIYVEIKYMEEGIFNTPDTRKIAYDFLHFRQQYKDKFYILISGAKLAAHKDVLPMLQTYTDHVFDLNVHREGWSDRLTDIIEEIQNMLNLKPEKNYKLPSIQVKKKELRPQPEMISTKTLEQESLSHATRTGRKFESEFKRRMAMANVDFEPMKGLLRKKVKLPHGNRSINIELDLWIPNFSDPKIGLECKNMRHIADSFAKTIAMDSIFLKSAIPSFQYIVVCGNRTGHVSAGYMNGYVDDVITYQKIPSFIQSLLSCSVY